MLLLNTERTWQLIFVFYAFFLEAYSIDYLAEVILSLCTAEHMQNLSGFLN